MDHGSKSQLPSRGRVAREARAQRRPERGAAEHARTPRAPGPTAVAHGTQDRTEVGALHVHGKAYTDDYYGRTRRIMSVALLFILLLTHTIRATVLYSYDGSC